MAVMITIPTKFAAAFRDTLERKFSFSEDPIEGVRKIFPDTTYFILTDRQNTESETLLSEVARQHGGSFRRL